MPSIATSQDGTVPDDSRLRRLVNNICKAASSRDAASKDGLSDAVAELSQFASIHGLPQDDLDKLIDLLTVGASLDASSAGTIIKNLYPRNKVSEDIVVKIVSCFGQGQSKPSLQNQAQLLRWLLMVYSVLDGYTLLSQLYGVLFNMLDMITLRAHMCHLLAKLTKRKHVKPFRIQALLELRRIVGNEQPLLGLLQVYKDCYPDVITELAPTRQFSHPSPDWLQNLHAIQEAYAFIDPGFSDKTSFQVARKLGSQGNKRRKTGHLTVPEVRTLGAVEASITLEEVDNVGDFVAKLEKLELPNQLAAVLDDPLLQKLLNLRQSTATQRRIDNWLSVYLTDEFSSDSSSSLANSHRGAAFEKILGYTQYTKVLLPALKEYLEEAIRKKNAVLSEYTLPLLSFLPLQDFADLKTRFFDPLNAKYSKEGPVQQAKLLDFYTGLFRHWILIAKSRNLQSALPVDLEQTNLKQYVRHVGSVCIAMLQKTSQSVRVLDAALSFFEVAATVPVEISAFRLVLPPDSLVYYSLFSGNGMSLSRMCGILSNYKRAFTRTDTLAKSDNRSDLEPYSQLYIDHFNGFVMDVCNCIWRNRALIHGDQNALACNLPQEVLALIREMAVAREENIQTLFSLSHSAVLSHFTAESFRELEDLQLHSKVRHLGPVTQKSLSALVADSGLKISYSDYKVAMLKDLDRKGLVGVTDLMYNTMASLQRAAAAGGVTSPPVKKTGK